VCVSVYVRVCVRACVCACGCVRVGVNMSSTCVCLSGLSTQLGCAGVFGSETGAHQAGQRRSLERHREEQSYIKQVRPLFGFSRVIAPNTSVCEYVANTHRDTRTHTHTETCTYARGRVNEHTQKHMHTQTHTHTCNNLNGNIQKEVQGRQCIIRVRNSLPANSLSRDISEKLIPGK
jgi:hypothetical protein